MRILIVADIHANWPALSAIREKFDACLFLGDVVDYATDPVPCIEWIRHHAAVGVRGNHDHAVAQRVPIRRQSGLSVLAAATRAIHWNQLDAKQTKFLARLPITRRITIDGKTLFLVHATPRDPLDEYVPAEHLAWESRVGSIDADYVFVGHTHQQFALDLGRLQVVNPGSVGQPRDGDPRCAYAVLENGRLAFRRVAYDIDATLKHMRTTGLEESLLELAEQMLRTGGAINPETWEKLNGNPPHVG